MAKKQGKKDKKSAYKLVIATFLNFLRQKKGKKSKIQKNLQKKTKPKSRKDKSKGRKNKIGKIQGANKKPN